MWKLSHVTAAEEKAILAKAEKAVAALKARKDLGFLELPEKSELWTSSLERARELRKTSHSMVVLGMGGSSLGGRALLQGLKKWDETHEVEFIDNVDADRFWNWLRAKKSHAKLQNTHFVIISKSGNTIETLSMAEFIDQHLRASGFKKISANSTVISEIDDNPLMRWARREEVPALEIPKNVGGRFSVLSPVGLLPAAFYGLDLEDLREGARWALEPAQEKFLARLVAQTLASFSRSEWISLFWAYSDGLRDFGLWTQQLWAESLGKAKGRDGKAAPRVSTPIPAVGSSDQHSILQQVIEGTPDKFLWFFRVEKSESEGPALEKNLFDCQALMAGKTMGQLFGAMASATSEALAQKGVQSLTLTTEELNEKTLGALLMSMEIVVGALGEALEINAFDQPGVEHGKILARRILSSEG
jgi:glucose-6-phosphate isomerase